MDELQAWLAKGSQAENPLKELREKQEEIESYEALFRQCDNYRKAVAYLKTRTCVCGFRYANATIVKCCYH